MQARSGRTRLARSRALLCKVHAYLYAIIREHTYIAMGDVLRQFKNEIFQALAQPLLYAQRFAASAH
jgi:hypothetical protein